MAAIETNTFNLDLNDLVEAAFKRAGSELRSGYDLRTAHRCLNMLTIEWANRGIKLWSIEQGRIALRTGISAYNLPTDTIVLLDIVLRTNEGTANATDIIINPISESIYTKIPNKITQGRPIQVCINQKSGTTTSNNYPIIKIWPAPDAPYVFIYWSLRRITNAGVDVNTPDIPICFVPAMIAGLAYYLSTKISGSDPNHRMVLKAEYDQQFQLATVGMSLANKSIIFSRKNGII